MTGDPDFELPQSTAAFCDGEASDIPAAGAIAVLRVDVLRLEEDNRRA